LLLDGGMAELLQVTDCELQVDTVVYAYCLLLIVYSPLLIIYCLFTIDIQRADL